MPQVSFYPLSDPDPDARLQFTCRLAEKARRSGYRVCILVDSDSDAAKLDALLWNYKPAAFLPHTLAKSANQDGEEEQEAVLIGDDVAALKHNDMLINLSGKPCTEHERFARIDEILCADAEILAAGRELFKFYRAAGYQPKTHKL